MVFQEFLKNYLYFNETFASTLTVLVLSVLSRTSDLNLKYLEPDVISWLISIILPQIF